MASTPPLSQKQQQRHEEKEYDNDDHYNDNQYHSNSNQVRVVSISCDRSNDQDVAVVTRRTSPRSGIFIGQQRSPSSPPSPKRTPPPPTTTTSRTTRFGSKGNTISTTPPPSRTTTLLFGRTTTKSLFSSSSSSYLSKSTSTLLPMTSSSSSSATKHQSFSSSSSSQQQQQQQSLFPYSSSVTRQHRRNLVRPRPRGGRWNSSNGTTWNNNGGGCNVLRTINALIWMTLLSVYYFSGGENSFLPTTMEGIGSILTLPNPSFDSESSSSSTKIRTPSHLLQESAALSSRALSQQQHYQQQEQESQPLTTPLDHHNNDKTNNPAMGKVVDAAFSVGEELTLDHQPQQEKERKQDGSSQTTDHTSLLQVVGTTISLDLSSVKQENHPPNDYSINGDSSSSSSSSLVKDERPEIVHIIHTRFMQDQPQLIELGLARLKLLQTFCLPSLQQQSLGGKFLWIIRTDPNLNETIKQPLIDTLKGLDYNNNDYDNKNKINGEDKTTNEIMNKPLHHLLLASNDHPNLQVDSLLEILTNHTNMIWSGNVEWARWYLEATKSTEMKTLENEGDTTDSITSKVLSQPVLPSPPILETRLDADDGLHTMFIEYLDFEARKSLLTSPRDLEGTESHQEHHEDNGHGDDNPRQKVPEQITQDKLLPIISPATKPLWKIWCASRHFEWQYHVDWKTSSGNDDKDPHLKDQHHETVTAVPPDPDLGGLVTIRLKGCVSSGLTIGYTAGVSVKDLPLSMRHDTLHKHMPICPASTTTTTTSSGAKTSSTAPPQDDEKEEPKQHDLHVSHHHHSHHHKKSSSSSSSSSSCLQFMSLAPTLLRARTPTSAGMWNVLVGTGTSAINGTTTTTTVDTPPAAKAPVVNNKTYQKGVLHQESLQDQLWVVSNARFGFTEDSARDLHHYFANHMQAIARENLLGQCTHGHSCKESSRLLLESILKQ